METNRTENQGQHSPGMIGKPTVNGVWERATRGISGMDRNTFSELMNGLWSGCGRTALPDKTTLRVWYFCLHDLTESQFATAVMRYLTEHSKEYLTVQLIRELSGVQQAKEESSLAAWDEAIAAVRIVGSYQSPAFSHPVTSHVIESLGGWCWFCGQSPEDLRNWVRARFLKTFESLSLSVRTQVPVRLKNLITMSGGTSGDDVPVRIGEIVRRRIE